jgi:hypothetical protein
MVQPIVVNPCRAEAIEGCLGLGVRADQRSTLVRGATGLHQPYVRCWHTRGVPNMHANVF